MKSAVTAVWTLRTLHMHLTHWAPCMRPYVLGLGVPQMGIWSGTTGPVPSQCMPGPGVQVLARSPRYGTEPIGSLRPCRP